MLQTLQCHFADQCTPKYITLCSMNDTSPRLGRHASSSSGLLIFRLSMLSAVFRFCCC